jgi:hypothetical protein
MARTGTCKTCGKKIRPSAKDMSVGAASRIHYWKYHPEVMLGGQAKKKWDNTAKTTKKKARR